MYMNGLSDFENTPGVTDGGMQDYYDSNPQPTADPSPFGGDVYAGLISQGIKTWVTLDQADKERAYNLALAQRGYAPPGYTRSSPVAPYNVVRSSPFQTTPGAAGTLSPMLLILAAAVAAFFILKK